MLHILNTFWKWLGPEFCLHLYQFSEYLMILLHPRANPLPRFPKKPSGSRILCPTVWGSWIFNHLSTISFWLAYPWQPLFGVDVVYWLWWPDREVSGFGLSSNGPLPPKVSQLNATWPPNSYGRKGPGNHKRTNFRILTQCHIGLQGSERSDMLLLIFGLIQI